MKNNVLLSIAVLCSLAFSLKTDMTSSEAHKAFTDLILAIACKEFGFYNYKSRAYRQ